MKFSNAAYRMIALQQNLKYSYSAPQTANSPILFENLNEYFVKVTLNRPKSLNSLDLEMIHILKDAQNDWNQKNKLAVWLQGSGKAFCAGGDIKSLYDAKKSNDQSKKQILEQFFRQEFILDYQLTQMKPVQISVLDGIVMGGGVGISVHSPIKIATEQSLFAMPEAKIGLFTDVGGGYFLSRLRNNIGLYLGLTGARLKGQELVQTGVAQYFVPQAKLPELQNYFKENIGKSLNNLEEIKAAVSSFSQPVEQKYKNEEEINKLFQGPELIFILKNLENSKTEFAQQTFKTINQQNAISLRVIFEQIKRGKNMNLKDCFKMDFILTQRFMEGNDFFEGVRTVLIDKTDTPKWTYKSPNDVPNDEVAKYFTLIKGIPELEI